MSPALIPILTISSQPQQVFYLNSECLERKHRKNYLVWEDLVKTTLFELNDTDEEELLLLNKCSDAKFIQVNKTDLYIVGGQKQFKCEKSLLLVNLDLATVQVKEGLLTRCSGFAICAIGHQIYVIGGEDKDEYCLDSCEIYNTFKDEWKTLACKLPDDFTYGINVVATK